jgi:hypothetical protein
LLQGADFLGGLEVIKPGKENWRHDNKERRDRAGEHKKTRRIQLDQFERNPKPTAIASLKRKQA